MGYRRTCVQCLMCAWRMQQERPWHREGAVCCQSGHQAGLQDGPGPPGGQAIDGVGWGALCGYAPPPLPFGLSSAPKILTAVADAIEWIARHEGIQSIRHYLDDFLLIAPPDSEIGQMDLDHLLTLFERLQIPVALHKLEGPAGCITFLGIEVDTQAMVLRLPRAKIGGAKEAGA